MQNEFRFFLLAEGASMRPEDGSVDLTGIVDTLTIEPNSEIDLKAIVSAVLVPDMHGRSLDMMFWRYAEGTTDLEKVPGFVGRPLILPKATGPKVMPFDMGRVAIDRRGFYGCHLWDHDGIFGEPEKLLATYLFGIQFSK
jgi:hypothetical protein